VQQGMNGDKKQARRYHWHSEDLKSFVDEPHSAIDGPAQGEIVNLTDKRAETSRAAQLELLTDLGPGRIVSELAALSGETPAQALLPHLIMPAHHEVRSSDVFTRRLHATLAAAAERGPVDFPDLLLTPGVGARTVRSLAMVAEVVHGAPYRFRDPARFSLAHGGKDRHPYPVPLKIFDETIRRVMKSAVLKAKLGRDEEMQALKRLASQARQLEAQAEGPSLKTSQSSARPPPHSTADPFPAGRRTCLQRRSPAPDLADHRIKADWKFIQSAVPAEEVTGVGRTTHMCKATRIIAARREQGSSQPCST
jgi:uncharacterized protein